MGNLGQFLAKWNGVETDGEEILTQAAKKEAGNLKNTLKMVVCATFQFRVDQTEMKHVTRALRRTFHDRGSVSGANINLLLTEREGRTGEYWPEVVAVRTERSEVRTKRPRANIPRYGSS